MSSITNAAEDLAYFPCHTRDLRQPQGPSNIIYMKTDTSCNDPYLIPSSSLFHLGSQREVTDHERNGCPEQSIRIGESRMHRINDDDEHSSSPQIASPKSFNCSRTSRRPPQDATKESRQISYSPSNSVRFDARKQFIRTLVNELWRWLVTGFFVGIPIASILHYKSQKVLSPGQVAKFTAINVRLSIILGFNIASALKTMLLNVRWRVVSQKIRPLSEIDIFLRCDSLLGLIKAAYITRRPKVIMVCLGILLLNLSIQISLATLSLAYSIETTVQHALFQPDSQIWITNFHTFRAVSGPKLRKRLQSFLAYNRGIDGPATKSCDISHPDCQIPGPGTTRENISTDYWRSDSYWRYTLLEHPPYQLNRSGVGYPPSGPGDLSVFSGQNIITRGHCSVNAAVIAGSNETTNWISKKSNRNITHGNGLPGSTRFLIPSATSLPTCIDEYSTSVWAYEAGLLHRSRPSNSTGWFYKCCISISEVTYPDDHEAASRRVPPDIAKVAAAAIGLQGFHKRGEHWQDQTFLAETYFGSPQKGNATGMAMLIAEFAIRVFASSGYENPMVSATGGQPQQGSKLNIDNAILMQMILPFIVSLHFTCLVVSVLLTYRIAIPDSSPLSMANKFYQHIGLLGGRGSLLSGRQIAEALGNPELVYTAASLQNGRHRQAIFESKNSADSRVKFHAGIYL